MKNLNITLKDHSKELCRLIAGAALCSSLSVDFFSHRAEAIVILDNTPAPAGFNQFAAPANLSDGDTHILSRGYAFRAGGVDYSIDSVSAYIYDVFDSSFNNIVPTARLELRSFDGSTPGQLLESLQVSMSDPYTSPLGLATFSVPAWNISANTSYWLGLNWMSPYNQGNSTVASSALFAWSVSSPSLPTLDSGFNDLGFWQFVIGPSYPSPGSWASVPYALQSNSLRINALPNMAQAPAPLPLIGLGSALAYSRHLRKRLRG